MPEFEREIKTKRNKLEDNHRITDPGHKIRSFLQRTVPIVSYSTLLANSLPLLRNGKMRFRGETCQKRKSKLLG